MENQDIKIAPFGIKFGVIASLTVIIYSMVLNLTGLNMNQGLGMVTYVIMGAVMYVACKNYKEANNEFLSFGGAFGISMIVAAISSVFTCIFTYVYMVFIDESILELVKDRQLEELEKQGLTDAQIEQSMEMMESFMSPGMISIMAFVMMLIIGAIIGLIVSAIVKNPRPMFE